MSAWRVQFAGDYFVTTTTVYAADEEQAEIAASRILKEYYGWDMDGVANEIEAEEL